MWPFAAANTSQSKSYINRLALHNKSLRHPYRSHKLDAELVLLHCTTYARDWSPDLAPAVVGHFSLPSGCQSVGPVVLRRHISVHMVAQVRGGAEDRELCWAIAFVAWLDRADLPCSQ